MKRLLASEVLKLRTIRFPWVLLGGCMLLVTAGVFGVIASGADVHDPDNASKALAHIGLVAVFGLVLGITAFAGEHRHHTIVDTYLASPRRSRVFSAKLIVYGAAGTAYGVASAAIAVLVTFVVFSAKGGSLDVTAGSTWQTIVGGIGWNLGFTVIGVSVGALIRNVATAISVALGWIAVVEGVIGQLIGQSTSRWLPFASGLALGRADPTNTEQLAQWMAALAIVAYATSFALAARSFTLERDVT